MNHKQRKVILIGIALAVLMGIIPPWNHTWISPRVGGFPVEKPAGYHLLFLPPPTANPSAPWEGVRIDFGKLFLSWFVLSVVAGTLFFLFKNKKPEPEESSPGIGESHSIQDGESSKHEDKTTKSTTISTGHGFSQVLNICTRCQRPNAYYDVYNKLYCPDCHSYIQSSSSMITETEFINNAKIIKHPEYPLLCSKCGSHMQRHKDLTSINKCICSSCLKDAMQWHDITYLLNSPRHNNAKRIYLNAYMSSITSSLGISQHIAIHIYPNRVHGRIIIIEGFIINLTTSFIGSILLDGFLYDPHGNALDSVKYFAGGKLKTRDIVSFSIEQIRESMSNKKSMYLDGNDKMFFILPFCGVDKEHTPTSCSIHIVDYKPINITYLGHNFLTIKKRRL